jgi:hypothetical protein
MTTKSPLELLIQKLAGSSLEYTQVPLVMTNESTLEYNPIPLKIINDVALEYTPIPLSMTNEVKLRYMPTPLVMTNGFEKIHTINPLETTDRVQSGYLAHPWLVNVSTTPQVQVTQQYSLNDCCCIVALLCLFNACINIRVGRGRF